MFWHHLWVLILFFFCVITYFMLWPVIGVAYGLCIIAGYADQMTFFGSIFRSIGCMFCGPFAHYWLLSMEG